MNFKSNLSLSQVKNLAHGIAKQKAKKGLVIGLTGPLGSGKTTFAQAFAAALGIKNLKSPSFIISLRHRLPKRFLYHLDFYRLRGKKDLHVLGLDEIFKTQNIALIEWADKFPLILKECDLVINFKVKPDNKRDIKINFK